MVLGNQRFHCDRSMMLSMPEFTEMLQKIHGECLLLGVFKTLSFPFDILFFSSDTTLDLYHKYFN